MTRRRTARGVAPLGLALVLAACSVTSPDELDYHVTGEAPASADAVFQKAQAWVTQHPAWQVTTATSPTQLSLQRALAGQNRSGRIELTTSAGKSAGSTAYDIAASTAILGIKARDNDAEVVADAQTLGAALSCPAAKWSTCP
jgi:outer membrane PBP1 activator LpoA protein